MTRKTKTTRQLVKEYLKYWIRQLGLTHWKVEHKVSSDVESMHRSFGTNSMNPNYEYCKITVLDPKEIPESWVGVRDIEVTLVHELLHAKLVYCVTRSSRDKDKWAEEKAVEQISMALVAARRGIKIEELK